MWNLESLPIQFSYSVKLKPIGPFHLWNGLLAQLHKRETEEVVDHSWDYTPSRIFLFCFKCHLSVIFLSFLYVQRVCLESLSPYQIQNTQPPVFYPWENTQGHQAMMMDGPRRSPKLGWDGEIPTCMILNPVGAQGIMRTWLLQVVRLGWKAGGLKSRQYAKKPVRIILSSCISITLKEITVIINIWPGCRI